MSVHPNQGSRDHARAGRGRMTDSKSHTTTNQAVHIAIGGNRLNRITLSVRKRLLTLIAGSDSIMLNVDVAIRREGQAVLNANNKRAFVGGNCTFAEGLKITTNGGHRASGQDQWVKEHIEWPTKQK